MPETYESLNKLDWNELRNKVEKLGVCVPLFTHRDTLIYRLLKENQDATK